MSNLDVILGDIKTKGYKLTPVRKVLIEVLLKSSTPLSINDLILQLTPNKLRPNKTTIYREIKFLKDLNLLEEVDFGDGKKMYEVSKNHHHHIRCIQCKTIKDVLMESDLNSEEQKILKKMGFKPVGHSLEFFGLCSNCQ